MSDNHLPQPTPHSLPFWDNCHAERLTAPRCTACGKVYFPPRPACPYCLSPKAEFEHSKGLGEVYSFTTISHAPHPDFVTPYVVALIQLDEGWKIGGNIIGCAPGDVYIGMRVKVTFRRASDQITIPFFEPIPSVNMTG